MRPLTARFLIPGRDLIIGEGRRVPGRGWLKLVVRSLLDTKHGLAALAIDGPLTTWINYPDDLATRVTTIIRNFA